MLLEQHCQAGFSSGIQKSFRCALYDNKNLREESEKKSSNCTKHVQILLFSRTSFLESKERLLLASQNIFLQCHSYLNTIVIVTHLDPTPDVHACFVLRRIVEHARSSTRSIWPRNTRTGRAVVHTVILLDNGVVTLTALCTERPDTDHDAHAQLGDVGNHGSRIWPCARIKRPVTHHLPVLPVDDDDVDRDSPVMELLRCL